MLMSEFVAIFHPLHLVLQLYFGRDVYGWLLFLLEFCVLESLLFQQENGMEEEGFVGSGDEI